MAVEGGHRELVQFLLKHGAVCLAAKEHRRGPMAGWCPRCKLYRKTLRKSAQQPAAAVQAAPPPPEPPRESSYQVLEEEFGSLDFDAEIQRMKREGQVGLPATDIDPTPSRRY